MRRYIVMSDNGDPRGDGERFIRDGFQPLGFVLPVVWLLWNRLWLQAAVAFALMGLAAAMADTFMPAALATVSGLANLAAGLVTAFEGPAWLVADLERKGQTVQDVVIAGSRNQAEEIFASRLPEAAGLPRPSSRGFQPVSQASLIPLAGA